MPGCHVGLRNVPDSFAVTENYVTVLAAMQAPPDKDPAGFFVELTRDDGAKVSIARAAIAYVIERRR